MKLERVLPGDVVRCAINGRTGIWGEVTEIKDGIVYFWPLCPATGWRHASATAALVSATVSSTCRTRRDALTRRTGRVLRRTEFPM
ncbi:MAG: hypothetical protein WBP81_27630 [Solirubrobacteraceae bacterium]